jgi:hypothetical protein
VVGQFRKLVKIFCLASATISPIAAYNILGVDSVGWPGGMRPIETLTRVYASKDTDASADDAVGTP